MAEGSRDVLARCHLVSIRRIRPAGFTDAPGPATVSGPAFQWAASRFSMGDNGLRARFAISLLCVTDGLPAWVLRRQYGRDPQQYGDLRVSRADPERGVVVLVHGGFWRVKRDLSTTTPIAQALASAGWNVWNIEYRRGADSGWEQTIADCTAALEYVETLADELGLRADVVVVVGHSAGGQLAATACRRADRSAVDVTGLVTLNGVLDLTTGAAMGIGDGAVTEFLGGSPDDAPETYRHADPTLVGHLGTSAICLHSRDDERVPFVLTENFVRAARTAGDVRLVEIPGDHVAPIDERSSAWPYVESALESFGLVPDRPGALSMPRGH